jgi:hypothetical protein
MLSLLNFAMVREAEWENRQLYAVDDKDNEVRRDGISQTADDNDVPSGGGRAVMHARRHRDGRMRPRLDVDIAADRVLREAADNDDTRIGNNNRPMECAPTRTFRGSHLFGHWTQRCRLPSASLGRGRRRRCSSATSLHFWCHRRPLVGAEFVSPDAREGTAPDLPKQTGAAPLHSVTECALRGEVKHINASQMSASDL